MRGKGNIYGRLERLEESVEQPGEAGHSEAWERAQESLATVHSLILEHGDEIDRNYKERIEAGEEHLPALIAAKREALGKTEEGRRAWAVADAIWERGGEG